MNSSDHGIRTQKINCVLEYSSQPSVFSVEFIVPHLCRAKGGSERKCDFINGDGGRAEW